MKHEVICKDSRGEMKCGEFYTLTTARKKARELESMVAFGEGEVFIRKVSE